MDGWLVGWLVYNNGRSVKANIKCDDWVGMCIKEMKAI